MSSMNYKLTVSCLGHLHYSSRQACKGFRLLTTNFNSDAELIMCRTLCVTNNCITNRYLSSSTEKSLNSLSDSIIGMVMKRQQHANQSWFNFPSSADETFGVSKSKSYNKAYSHWAKKKPVYTGHFRSKVFMFLFFSIVSVDGKQIFSKPILYWLFEFTDDVFHTWSFISILLQASPNKSSKHTVCHHGNLLVAPVRIR